MVVLMVIRFDRTQGQMMSQSQLKDVKRKRLLTYSCRQRNRHGNGLLVCTRSVLHRPKPCFIGSRDRQRTFEHCLCAFYETALKNEVFEAQKRMDR